MNVLYRSNFEQSDIEDIKDIFSSILQSLTLAKQLLLILWIREGIVD